MVNYHCTRPSIFIAISSALCCFPSTHQCMPSSLAGLLFVFAFGLCLVPVGKALSIGHRVWLPPEALRVQGAVVPNLFDFGGTLGCLSVNVISKHEVFSFPVL